MWVRMRSRLLAALAALAVAVPALALAQTAELIGTVGPDFTIALTRPDGSAVATLDPGAYTMRVDDRSEEHNFHFTGPGVDMATSAAAVETATWPVSLVDGRYTIVCDVHPIQMRRTIVVGNPPPAPPPPTPPPPLGRLTATVGPGLRIVVSARSVRSGRYAITVRDRSATENFHLTGPGLNRRTGVAFRGQARWTVTLRKGTYRFRSDRTVRLRGTLRVN
jgi:hypothetical protein